MPLPGIRRRAPYPTDIQMTGITGVTGTFGFMLGRPDKGAPLIARKPAGLTAGSPSQANYSAQSGEVEATYVWNDLSYGMGLRFQHTTDDKRYYYALGADCSVGGFVLPGPLITVVTPTPTVDATNGISHFFRIGTTLYALNGRYCLVRAGDTAADWTVSKDFGVGKAALDVVVFTDNATGTQLAMVAMGDTELFWSFDGTTWTQHATLYSRAWCTTGVDLYRASDANLLSMVNQNANPLTAGNWAAANAFRIGDKSANINRMMMTGSAVMIIIKDDGCYTIDELGFDQKRWSDLSPVNDTTNGKWAFRFEDDIHIGLSGRHFSITPDLNIQPNGPERYTENDSLIHGYTTAGVATPYAAYVGIYNPDSGHSYLAKYGAWPAGNDPDPHRMDVWHASLTPNAAPWQSVKITAMYRDTIGAASAHERVYIGFSNGAIGYFLLPCTANPTACTNYAFNTGVNSVYLPQWHGGYPGDEKHLRSAVMTGVNLAAATVYGNLLHRTTATGSWTTAINGTNYFDAMPARRIPFPTDIVGTTVEFQIQLTGKPYITGTGVSFMVREHPTLIYEFSIICEDGMVKWDGVPFHYGADKILSLIRSAVSTRGSVTVTLPDETTQELVLTNYEESYVWDDRTQDNTRAALRVTAVQANSISAFEGGTTLALT